MVRQCRFGRVPKGTGISLHPTSTVQRFCIADKSRGNFMWRGGEGSMTTKEDRLVIPAKPG